MRRINYLFCLIVACGWLFANPAAAQSTLDDDGAPQPAVKEPQVTQPALGEPVAEYGIGVRGFLMITPKFLLEAFFEEVPSGGLNPGFALEFVRRKGEFELAVGLGYNPLSTDDGPYLEKGDDPAIPGQTPDFTEFDGFGWITADVLFMWHKPLHEKVSLRYGAGIGLGIMVGNILQTDTTCTNSNTASCTPIMQGQAGEFRAESDTPPVFPVVNLVGGIQFKPIPKLAINVETGLRTTLFVGTKVAYFF